ncbi:retrovirus-related pol polyprotein from transposon TNT 1-94 [Tanacetum coccineum]
MVVVIDVYIGCKEDPNRVIDLVFVTFINVNDIIDLVNVLGRQTQCSGHVGQYGTSKAGADRGGGSDCNNDKERGILAKVKEFKFISELLKHMSSEGFDDVGLRYVWGTGLVLDFDSMEQVGERIERCVLIRLGVCQWPSWAPEVNKKLVSCGESAWLTDMKYSYILDILKDALVPSKIQLPRAPHHWKPQEYTGDIVKPIELRNAFLMNSPLKALTYNGALRNPNVTKLQISTSHLWKPPKPLTEQTIPSYDWTSAISKRLLTGLLTRPEMALVQSLIKSSSDAIDESIDSAFARFNTSITSLKALDEGYFSKNYVRKFHRALHTKWRAKDTTIEESKDLTSLSLDELIGNLKVHEMIIKKDFEIVKAKGERRSLDLKAKKEYSDEECLTFGSEDEEYAMVVRDFKKFFKRRGNDLNHLIGECPKRPKDKNQRAFIGSSWSDSDDEDDEKTKDEACLMAHVSSKICLGVDLEPDEWIKDSGCSKHMTGNRKLFSTYKAYNGGNVIFGSNLHGNIIGKGEICDNKYNVIFSEHDSEITKDGKVIGRGIRKSGLEFDNEVKFGEFCNANGITHNFSAPRTPQSNGVVKRKNRTLQEMSRTMLNEKSLPQKFWCNAIDTSTYILNRILIRAILGKTPYELFRGRKLTLDYFKVFGSKCFILNIKYHLTKFDTKSYEGVFLGYTQNSKAYIILNKHTMKIEESPNVTIDETPPSSKKSPLVDDDLDEEEAIKVIEMKNLENDIEDETLEIDEVVNVKESRNHPLENFIGNLNQRTLRSQAQNQSNFFCFISTIEPKNVNEALKDESCIIAMQEELNRFVANDCLGVSTTT